MFKNIKTSEVNGSLLIDLDLSDEEIKLMESILNVSSKDKELFKEGVQNFVNEAIINFLELKNG